jgi:hypothetical protein
MKTLSQETFTNTPLSVQQACFLGAVNEENSIGTNTDNSLILNSIFQSDA